MSQLGTYEIRQFAKSGLLVDLKPFVEGPEGLNISAEDAPIFEAGMVDGGLYWLPFNVSVPVLYCNEDAFREAGVESIPATWEAFYDTARQLTRRDEQGRVTQAGVALWNISWPYLSMIWSEGGELASRDYASITLNDPVAVEVLSRLQGLVREGAAVMPDKATGGHRAAFQSGMAAMLPDSPAACAELLSDGNGFKAVAGVFPAGRAGRVFAPGGGGLVMMATTPAETRESAWAFMRYLLSAESLAYYSEQTGYVAYTEGARAALRRESFPAGMEAVHESARHIRGDFTVNMAPGVRNALGEAIQAILINLADVQATLDAADARAEEAMARESGQP